MKYRTHSVLLVLALIVGFVDVLGAFQDVPGFLVPPPPMIFEPPPMVVVGTATGTGFVIYSNDQFALILTNEHVIGRAPRVTVGSFPNGRTTRRATVSVGGSEYESEVLAMLPNSDVALLICGGLAGIPALPLGNSDSLDIGDKVYALGCPGGICNTVTEGRVANMDVTIRTDGGNELYGMIMMDSTIDHGSSGGPLVNARGEVVGINTAGSEESRFGFAIPIAQALRVLGELPHAFREFLSEAAQELLSEAGRTTSARPEITAREARDRISPSTLFVSAPVEVDLRLLLPREIDRYVMDPVAHCSPGPIGGWEAQHPAFPAAPSTCVILGGVSKTAIGVSHIRGRAGSFAISVAAIAHSDKGSSSLGAGRIREYYLDHFVDLLGYRQVAGGVLTLGNLEIPWNALYKTDQYVPSINPQGVVASGVLSGTIAFSYGNVVLVVTLTWGEKSEATGTRDLARAGKYTWSSNCLSYQPYQSTRSTTLICLQEFLAELERVFGIASRAFFDGLP